MMVEHAVDGGGVDPDAHLALARFGRGRILIFQNVRRTIFVENRGLHERLPVVVFLSDRDHGKSLPPQAQTKTAGREARPFRSLDDVRALLRREAALSPTDLSVGSSYFEVHGRLRLESATVRERSLVYRLGTQVSTLWRTRAGNGARGHLAERRG